MTTTRDEVEAQAFERRRLVTAFVSGAPRGHEVEPSRPGRAIVAGLAIAVLMVAGGAAYRLAHGDLGSDWRLLYAQTGGMG